MLILSETSAIEREALMKLVLIWNTKRRSAQLETNEAHGQSAREKEKELKHNSQVRVGFPLKCDFGCDSD